MENSIMLCRKEKLQEVSCGMVQTMKYIRQFFIIMAVSFLGEVLKWLLPLPIPASIYGLVLLFLALYTKVLRLEQIEDTANFLIEIMPLMFVPAGVKLLVSWGELKPVLVPVVVIMVVSTIVVMVVSGLVTQAVLHRKGRCQETGTEDGRDKEEK